MSNEVRKTDVFQNGSTWLRADFHLHTYKDKEFQYQGDENYFVAEYLQKLKEANIGVGVIANHNKFDVGEFRALKEKAKRENIYLLPGVELSVNDGANGIHVIIVFAEEWIANGNDHVTQFLTSTFLGRVANEYENENGRSNHSLLSTINMLDQVNKDFFIVMAHIEDNKGFCRELDGGRIEEIGQKEEFRRRVLAFQKVRTHEAAAGRPCRTKNQHWLKGSYPAEVEGSIIIYAHR